jgi:phospholipid N-methyltransferase
VKDFATTAVPLHRLTDDANWQWTGKEQQAFDRLKAVLALVPVLKFPVPDAQYVLDTDASLTDMGAVLSQIKYGEKRVPVVRLVSLSVTIASPDARCWH